MKMVTTFAFNQSSSYITRNIVVQTTASSKLRIALLFDIKLVPDALAL